MFRTIVEKELKAILRSPKFVATFLVCTLLILLSTFVGIQEYRAALRQFETATGLSEQQMREETNWEGLSGSVFRRPEPMQIFVSGVNNDIGRFTEISAYESIKFLHSPYSDDPIFAVFRSIDVAFIFQVVLSLFAILFTYNAINGEREDGTLKLTFANPIPRATYLAAKFTGSLFGLITPLVIPILMSLFLVLLYRVPLTTGDWSKIGAFFVLSILFFVVFAVLGLLTSTLARHSQTSFLISLVAWVMFVLIIPKASIMAASQVIPVPSVAEIEGQQDGYAKQRWEKHREELQEKWRQRSQLTTGMTAEERETYRDDHSWDWMKEDDNARKKVQSEIIAYNRKLTNELRNRKTSQQKLALRMSRLSPASAYQLAAMNLASTGIDLKTRYEDAAAEYRTTFVDFIQGKEAESDGPGGIRVEVNSDSGFNLTIGTKSGALNLSELPRFQAPQTSLAETLAPAIVDFGPLSLYVLLGFAGATLGFFRYDVR